MAVSDWAAPAGTPRHRTFHTVENTGWDYVGCGIILAAVCPECRDGKHGNCIGYALDPVRDEVVACGCTH